MFKQVRGKYRNKYRDKCGNKFRNRWRDQSMGKYAEDAKQLLRLVGGRENIAAVSHCMTRMRFALAEPGKADVKAIEAMKVVKGSFTQSGQFQVIIGNTVADFYNDFVKEADIEGVSKDAVKQAAKKNQNVLQRMVTALAEIFAPLIPAIITGGLILGFRNCIDSLYLFENGTKTLCDISQFWSGIDSFLWLIGEAVFHMLPVGICWSVTRKMGTTQMLGIVLGLTLVSGQLLNAYAVAGTAAADIPRWDFGGFQVNMIGYQGQVIPAILAAFTLVVFAAVFGVIYAPLVITGLHHMSNAIDLQLIADYGGTMLWPMIALSNIAQGSAVLGMIWLQRKDPEAQEVNIPACISCYLGVTEPAIFGVNLKRGFPFVCAMIGSGIAAVVCVATGTTANAIGVGGIPGILSIQPQFMASFAVCMVIAFAVPFILTAAAGKKRLLAAPVNGTAELAEIAAAPGTSAAAGAAALVLREKEAQEEQGNASGKLTAFLSGTSIPLAEVGDGVFSAGILGDGMAIIPESGTLYAPADAEVAALMPDSRHACGLKLENGMEVLLHIGIDTVGMNGDGFEYLVQEGQKVCAGTPLIKFDRAKIRAAGHPDVTVCIISNMGNAKDIRFHTGMGVKENETAVATFR